MPIIVRAKQKDNNNAVIREFKKLTALADVVQRARDRRYFQKPSKVNAVKKIHKKRLQRKIRSLKHTKNIGADVIDKMTQRLNNT